MISRAIDNLGMVIHLDDIYTFRLAWKKLYGGMVYDPADYQEIVQTYQNAKHKIMLNELYGIRGFVYPRPESPPSQVGIEHALRSCITGMQAFYTAIGEVFIPSMERMRVSFEAYAESLNGSWGEGEGPVQSFINGMAQADFQAEEDQEQPS